VEKAAALAQMEERRKQHQADAQQRLAWVDEGLNQRLIEDNNCPVCCANAGWQTLQLWLCMPVANSKGIETYHPFHQPNISDLS